MKSVAVLDADSASDLMEMLRKAQIQCSAQVVTEESGLDATEVLVEESQYDQACDVSEKWQEARTAEAQAKLRRDCPKCRSARTLERVRDAQFDELGLVVFRCRQCGEEFPL